MHGTFEESLAFVLANKLSSPTLLPTNLMQLITKAYEEDPVRIAQCVQHALFCHVACGCMHAHAMDVCMDSKPVAI